MGFDYPITRPYPWRFTTLSVVAVSATVLGLVVYFNLVVVGTTTTNSISTTFEQEKSLSWLERVNLGKALNFSLGCDPTTLVAGGTYRTPNGAFTYTIQNFIDRNTRDVFSSINYNGSSLENCVVQTMRMFANFVSFDAAFQANINCSLPGDIDMMATALSSVTLRTDTDSSIMRRYDLQLIRSQTRATYLAAASSKLLAAFGIDFINQFLPRIPTIPNFTPGLSTVFSEFEILPDLSFRYLDGTWSGTGGVVQGPRLGVYFSDLSMAVFENYASVFWSTVLSDLGVSSKPNILTDVDLFHQTIHSNLSLPRGISVTWINGTAVDYVLSDTTSFHLPFNDVRPTLFNARYICRKVAWKEPGSLVGDVLVATISFFMAFWSGLHITLRYFAVGSSAHRNFCTCPTCKGQAEDKASDMISLNELNSPDAESHYEPLVQHT